MEGEEEGMNIVKTWESFLFWVEGGEGVGCWEGTEESVILDGILKIHLSCMFTHLHLPTWLITKKRYTYPLDVHSYRHSNRHHRRSVVRFRYQSKCRHDGRASYTAWILTERENVSWSCSHTTIFITEQKKEKKKKQRKKLPPGCWHMRPMAPDRHVHIPVWRSQSPYNRSQLVVGRSQVKFIIVAIDAGPAEQGTLNEVNNSDFLAGHAGICFLRKWLT